MNNIVVLITENNYDCLINREGFDALCRGSELETDLLERDSKQPTGKKVSLRHDDKISRDGDIEMVPEDASYDEAEKIRLIIGRDPYNMLRRENWCVARWSYGDIFVKLEKDLGSFR